MTFAEVREAEAPPDIAAIYAALRAATGVPLVNLIWRHLATMPGVLPWAWEATRPALESGAVAAARRRIADTIRLPAGLVPVDAAAWSAVGLAARDRAPVLGIVETYNRGNLTNLMLLTALRQAVEDAPAVPRPVRAAGAAPEPALPAVPPLPVLGALPAETQALVRDLGARHAGAVAGGVVPSLYLHLAHWPALLAALPRWLRPVLAELDAARTAAVAAAAEEAAALRPLLAPGTGVPGGHRDAVLAALTRFTTAVIPDMVPVGLALRQVLSAR